MPFLLRMMAVTAMFALLPHEATAAQFKDFDNYRIHYNAFSADLLHPEVAQSYGLRRSRYRGVLNITVQEKVGDRYLPVGAEIDTRAANRASQFREIGFREIREGEAIYYVGEFAVADQEVLNFDVQVQPEGARRPYEFHFRQQFFVD